MVVESVIGLLFMVAAGIAFLLLMVLGGLGFAAAVFVDLYREKRVWFGAVLLSMMVLGVAAALTRWWN